MDWHQKSQITVNIEELNKWQNHIWFTETNQQGPAVTGKKNNDHMNKKE